MSEPVPVIPLAYAESPVVPPIWRRVIRICQPLALVACGVAWALLMFDVETVIFTGPVLLAMGILLIIGGVITHSRVAVAFGIGHASICLLFFALVNLRNWSSNEAQTPFAIMGALYTTAAIALAASPWVRGMFKDPLVERASVTS